MDGSRTVLITGAAGFIGSHVVEALLKRGDRVVGFDNFDEVYPRRLKERNLEEVRAAAGAGSFTFIEGDITDAASVSRAFESARPSGVIHLAARGGVRPSIEMPALYSRINIEGTTTILEAARLSPDCSRLVLASSSSVYGNAPKAPFAETDDVSMPVSPYAATKRSCELIGATFSHLYKLPVACLRYFTVFGPRQRPSLAFALFMEKIAAGQPIQMFGDGSTSRDYTFISDIVTGTLAAYDRIPRHGYRIWNLGNSRPVTLREMIDTVSSVVGKPAKIDQRPPQPGDVERTFADLTRSRAELGYDPKVSLQEGVRRQWDWTRSTLQAAIASGA